MSARVRDMIQGLRFSPLLHGGQRCGSSSSSRGKTPILRRRTLTGAGSAPAGAAAITFRGRDAKSCRLPERRDPFAPLPRMGFPPSVRASRDAADAAAFAPASRRTRGPRTAAPSSCTSESARSPPPLAARPATRASPKPAPDRDGSPREEGRARPRRAPANAVSRFSRSSDQSDGAPRVRVVAMGERSQPSVSIDPFRQTGGKPLFRAHDLK